MSKGVFSASGEEVLERRLPELQIRNSFQEASCGGCQPEETLEEAYEINRCCSWIERIKVSRVALQFPDELLVDAPDVALAIEKRVGVEVFILGDTSYGRFVKFSHIALVNNNNSCLLMVTVVVSMKLQPNMLALIR